MPRWYTEYRCVSCDQELSHGQVFDSQGRCPKCGYKGKTSSTICKVVELGYKLVSDHPWWMFWKQPRRVYYGE